MKSDFFCPASLALSLVNADSGSFDIFAVFWAEVFLDDLMLFMLARFVPFVLSISRRLGGQNPELLLPVNF